MLFLAFVRVTLCVEPWLETIGSSCALLATSSAVAARTNRTVKLKELKYDHRIEDAGCGQRVSFNRACWGSRDTDGQTREIQMSGSTRVNAFGV